jgi:clan AA aspartic protease
MAAIELHDRPMGEVKVKVRLTNLFDSAAAQEGRLAPEKVRTVEVDAVVDTGAVRSVVPAEIARTLGLRPSGRQFAEYADGRTEEVGVLEGIRFEILNRRCADEALVLGDEVLIGQTVLEKMDLLVDCHRQQVMPHPDHPDYPVNKVR